MRIKPKSWRYSDLLTNPITLMRHIVPLLLLLLIGAPISAQDSEPREVTGTVTFFSSVGEVTAPGVNVVIKGTTTGTITDMDGNYTINASPDDIIEFSFIGYLTEEIPVGSRSNIDVLLIEDFTQLDEIVVIGYGTQRKRLVTGANLQVRGEDIQRQSTISPMQALQGQTPGMQITKSSGMPGEGYKINIRGMGTIYDASPLFIVDGVPVDNIDFLNPADIESIDVLKDAASAAIYGSRAANGVVLVTSKGGTLNTPATVTYDGYYGMQNVYKPLELLNAQQYAEIMQETQENTGRNLYDFASDVPRWSDIDAGRWEGTNWLDEVTVQNAPTQSHNINVSGGSQMSTYSLGLGYTQQQGILGEPVAPEYERYTMRINTDHVIFEKNGYNLLKVGENLNLRYSENSGIGIGNIYWNDIHNVLRTSPFLPMHDNKGDYHYAIPWNPNEANPVGLMEYERGLNRGRSVNISGNVYMELQPIENLVYRSSFGINASGGSYRSFRPEYDLSENNYSTYNWTTHNMNQGTSWIWENTVAYDFQVADLNRFNVLVGNSVEKFGLGESINASNSHNIFDSFDYAYLDNTPDLDPAVTQLGSSPWDEGAILSYFTRVNYNYDEKYMLSATFRADASSNFAEGNRWGFFPSVSAGWVVSDEAFMQGISDQVNFFKLRASWGQNGNQNILPFQYLSTISFQDARYFFGTDKDGFSTGAFPDILPNPDVKWETSEQINVGLDARFFNHKMNVAFDWYKKETKDWLVVAPILATFGTGAPYVNGGDVQNTGVELAIGWNDRKGDFGYNLGATLGYNKNEVTRIDNEEGIIRGLNNVLSQNTTEISHARVGYPIGVFWGFETDGLIQNEDEAAAYVNDEGDPYFHNTTPGDIRFIDSNGDGQINNDDKVMIGKPNPDFIFGLNLGFDYKGIDFSVMANGVAGNQIARSYRSFADNEKHNYTTEILDRWTGEGTSDRIPRLTNGAHRNNFWISDRYIYDGDYLRISNVTLGYDFKRIAQGLPMQQARLYVSVLNLHTFTNYPGMDPEIGYGGNDDNVDFASGIDLGFYPSPRTIMVGANIKF